MKRTTVVSAAGRESAVGDGAPERGDLKIFFGYAPCAGASDAMLDEAQGLMASGLDVLVADGLSHTARERRFDLDQALARRPDVVVLPDLARPNPEGSRNRTRYQDAEELLRAGVDVYATLRVGDLQNEQDRVRALGVDLPPEPVPDYLLYGARQLEFVDIDPEELVARARTAGREVPEGALNELRVLALRCVSDYASAAGRPDGRRAEAAEGAAAATGCTVALVDPGCSPGRVLLEAGRVASFSHTEVEVVCIRRERRAGSARALRDDAAYAELESQVEAMGMELTTLYGDDAVETLRDYLRAQGAADIVLARRRLPLARRLLAPFQAPFAERLVAGLSGVGIHLVADDGGVGPVRVGRGLFAGSELRGRDVAIAVGSCAAAFAIARVLQAFGFGEATPYLVYLGSFIVVALATHAYVPTLIAIVLGCLAQDYFFIRSYLDLAIDHRASLLLFIAFIVVSLGTSLAVVGVGRARRNADERERRTQALFDLNRNLVVTHGPSETVDIALDSTTRLFGRSTALYVRDPFDRAPAGSRERRGPAVRPVEGDLPAEVFEKLTEQAVAHWVFANGEPAGSGTDTHSASDVLYLPLASEEGVEGVLAVSERRRLTLAERSFLDLVANQVSFALERQSLAYKHRGDLQLMRASAIRSEFVEGLVASARTVSEMLHVLADALLAVPEDDRAYREALVRAIGDESARGRLMADRMRAVLDEPLDAVCDIRAVVARAVDEVREGLSGKLIELEPGEAVAPVVADSALLGFATRLILEAATGHVGKRGIVQVSVASYPDRVSVVVADDRPAEQGASHAAAFDLGHSAAGGESLVYDEERARAVREVLLDRAKVVASDQQDLLAALCRAMRIPEGAARSDGDRDGALNRQRILRLDRLEYGLYMAALMVRAHGGTIKQRYRLGGGAVVTFAVPRN